MPLDDKMSHTPGFAVSSIETRMPVIGSPSHSSGYISPNCLPQSTISAAISVAVVTRVSLSSFGGRHSHAARFTPLKKSAAVQGSGLPVPMSMPIRGPISRRSPVWSMAIAARRIDEVMTFCSMEP